jgi:hypothetical protein
VSEDARASDHDVARRDLQRPLEAPRRQASEAGRAPTLNFTPRTVSLLPPDNLRQQLGPAVVYQPGESRCRITIGGDGAIVVFNPDKVIEKATDENAAQYSEGIEQPGVGIRTK